MTCADTITDREISDAYHAARLRRIGFGLAKALETPAIYIALRCPALAMKRKQQRRIGEMMRRAT